MEGKLIKLEESKYTLVYKEGSIAWENNPAFDGKLSLKNCQAIENGYDLDELAVLCTKEETTIVGNQKMAQGFIKGFTKAIEILGDKKFSEEDMRRAMDKISAPSYYKGLGITAKFKERNRFIDAYIQSLQQTEWDVEIEMICPHPEDTYRCGMEYGCDADGCNHPNKVPYLDADGCLILKRK